MQQADNGEFSYNECKSSISDIKLSIERVLQSIKDLQFFKNKIKKLQKTRGVRSITQN